MTNVQLDFQGTDFMFMYAPLDDKSINRDNFFSINVKNAYNEIIPKLTQDIIQIGSFIAELTEITDLALYSAIDNATFEPNKLNDIFNLQQNVYFRFPQTTLDPTKKIVKVFYILFEQRVLKTKLFITSSVSTSFNIKPDILYNTHSILLTTGQSALVVLNKALLDPTKIYLIGFTNAKEAKMYSGSIVDAQESTEIKQLHLIEQGQTEDITLEFWNDDTEAANQKLSIAIQIEVIKNKESVEINYLMNNPEKIMNFQQGSEPSEWFMIDFFEKEEYDKPQWLCFYKLFGTMKIEYKTNMSSISLADPISLLTMDPGSTTEVKDLQLIKQLSIVKVSAAANSFAYLDMSLENASNEISVKGYEDIVFIVSQINPTKITIHKEVAVTNRLEIRIVGYQSDSDKDKKITIKIDKTSYELFDYKILHIEELKSKEIIITSPINVIMKVLYTEKDYYKNGELSYDIKKNIEVHQIKSERIMYKLKDPRVEQYVITFNKAIKDEFGYGVNKGFNDYLPNPVEFQESLIAEEKITIINPYIIHNQDLVIDTEKAEFYYMAWKFSLADMTNLEMTITKQYFEKFGVKRIMQNEAMDIKGYDSSTQYELEYEETNKPYLSVYTSLKIEPDELNSISISTLIGDNISYPLSSIKQFHKIDRKQVDNMVISVKFNMAKNLPILFSFSYMDEAEVEKLPDIKILSSHPIITSDSNSKNKITWEKLTIPISKYYIFVKNKATPNANAGDFEFETEEEMFNNKDSAFEQLDKDAIEYTLPKEKLENGNYLVNILAANEEGLPYFIAFKQTEIKIEHPSTNLTWLWIILGILSVVAIAGVVYLFLKKRSINAEKQSVKLINDLNELESNNQ